MEFLYDYLLFFGKTATIVIAIGLILGLLVGNILRLKQQTSDDRIDIKPLNDRYEAMESAFRHQLLDKKALKAWHKEQKQAAKEKAKQTAADSADKEAADKRIFVLDFDGDIRASQVERLREEITALLTIATADDEVVVRLESPGGVVHGYGLGASQLQRLRDSGIKLTVAVDKVAASGGYLMAVVADRIIAAPFAIVGSIGVVLQLPNFNKLLKKHDIEFEQITAGEHKRTLSIFGENTAAGRKKTKEEIEITHQQFKDFITRHRPEVDLKVVATGEHWQAIEALEMKLVDELKTSDQYLLEASREYPLYQVEFHVKQSLQQKLASAMQMAFERVFTESLFR